MNASKKQTPSSPVMSAIWMTGRTRYCESARRAQGNAKGGMCPRANSNASHQNGAANSAHSAPALRHSALTATPNAPVKKERYATASPVTTHASHGGMWPKFTMVFTNHGIVSPKQPTPMTNPRPNARPGGAPSSASSSGARQTQAAGHRL
ncbi:MAG: hypothetical protein HY804_07785 [Nitrospinae bacterium]|nr:hypothetical protein [Nitrospinota bacterium]